MENLRLRLRIWAMAALMGAAMLALMAVPEEGAPIGRWLALLLASKALSFALMYAAVRLYGRWRRRGGFGKVCDRLLDTEED